MSQQVRAAPSPVSSPSPSPSPSPSSSPSSSPSHASSAWPPAACPCGRQDARARPLAYAGCCGRYIDHFDTCPAPDAGSLMRSRYTAFVRENAAYLQATWAPEHRPAAIDFDPGTRWLGLDVRAQRSIDGDHAEVEFVARQRDATGRAHRLHERSRFVRADGRWFYVDGDLR